MKFMEYLRTKSAAIPAFNRYLLKRSKTADKSLTFSCYRYMLIYSKLLVK